MSGSLQGWSAHRYDHVNRECRGAVSFAEALWQRRGRHVAASREGAEIQRILAALDRNNNNRMRAAAELGISRMGLYKKLHKYGMMRPAS